MLEALTVRENLQLTAGIRGYAGRAGGRRGARRPAGADPAARPAGAAPLRRRAAAGRPRTGSDQPGTVAAAGRADLAAGRVVGRSGGPGAGRGRVAAGRAVLTASHDPRVVSAATIVLELDQGRIRVPPRRLRAADPRASRLGSTPDPGDAAITNQTVFTTVDGQAWWTRPFRAKATPAPRFMAAMVLGDNRIERRWSGAYAASMTAAPAKPMRSMRSTALDPSGCCRQREVTFTDFGVQSDCMHISPDRLLILRAVAASGGVGAAARQLHLAPSGISQHLARLERETGLVLVDRVHQRRSATAEVDGGRTPSRGARWSSRRGLG